MGLKPCRLSKGPQISDSGAFAIGTRHMNGRGQEMLGITEFFQNAFNTLQPKIYFLRMQRP